MTAWTLPPWTESHEKLKEELARKFSLDPLLMRLLLLRNVSDENSIQRFLFGTLSDLSNPFSLPDIHPATDRLLKAWSQKEKIVFFGDYDVDGITGTAILMSFFRELGMNPQAILPNRFTDGYGLTKTSVQKILESQPNLLVTIDNGTKSREEIQILKEQGIDVVVIDHHETPTEDHWPPVVALINPKRNDSQFSERELASAGLCFLLIVALRSKLRQQGVNVLPNLKRYLDLACLGTIADVVPMTGTNRLLVKYGLEEIASTKRLGLRSLLEKAQVSPPLRTSHVAFRLAPRINAAGRLKDPMTSLNLLLTSDPIEASELAQQLENDNRQRQTLEEKATREAITLVEEKYPNSHGIVVASAEWHLGVVGIVAAKLTEKFNRPAIVLSITDHGIAKGSARTVSGFSVLEALHRVAPFMDRYGGHAAAAGMTVQEEKLPQFTQAFDQAVKELWKDSQTSQSVVDAILPLNEVHLSFLKQLDLLAPHGPGNPEPLFVASDVRFENCRIVGQGNKGHLKSMLCQNGTKIDAIGFNWGHYLPTAVSQPNHQILYYPEINSWNGSETPQVRIKNISVSN